MIPFLQTVLSFISCWRNHQSHVKPSHKSTISFSSQWFVNTTHNIWQINSWKKLHDAVKNLKINKLEVGLNNAWGCWGRGKIKKLISVPLFVKAPESIACITWYLNNSSLLHLHYYCHSLFSYIQWYILCSGIKYKQNKVFQDLSKILPKFYKVACFVTHLLLQHVDKVVAKSSKGLFKILQDLVFFSNLWSLWSLWNFCRSYKI